jgi:hypothetical protein
MKIYSFLLSFFCSVAPFYTFGNPPPPIEDDSSAELVIYNRILAKVGGKTVSVIDVMKRMDLFLQKNYPQFAKSKTARFQFYSSQWQDYLNQIIDTELMLADAEKLELKVSEAEVREEVLNRFGPNVMPTLDSLGVSYDEARAMIQDEMIVQRMMWFRVNSKVLNNINSQDVKEAYAQYCANNPPLQEWSYQVLSIRSPNKTASEQLASKAFELLNSRLSLAAVPEQLSTPDELTTITISQEMKADEKSISKEHREVLEALSVNTYSKPIAQVSRIDNSVVYRIFHLKEHTKRETPTFAKMADQLKDQLLHEAAGKESAQYILRLRTRLGFDAKQMMETLPDGFQPFALR